MPSSGRLLRGALERAADGLLRAGPDRARCARPWRRGAPGLRQRLALGLHAGADRPGGPLRRPARPAHGARPRQCRCRRHRRRAGRPALRLGRRSLAPRRRSVRLARADRRGRRLPALTAARAARGAVGDQGAARRAAAALRGRLGPRGRSRAGDSTSQRWRSGP